MRTAFCSNIRLHKHFVEPTASPPDEPKKVRTNPFYLETVRRKIWDRFGFKTNLNCNSSCALWPFLLPHSSDDCTKKKSEPRFCRTFFCDYMRLLFLIQMYPILLRSCSFCPIVSFNPSSKNPCSEFLSATKHRFDAWLAFCRGDSWNLPWSSLILEQMSWFLDDICHAHCIL